MSLPVSLWLREPRLPKNRHPGRAGEMKPHEQASGNEGWELVGKQSSTLTRQWNNPGMCPAKSPRGPCGTETLYWFSSLPCLTPHTPHSMLPGISSPINHFPQTLVSGSACWGTQRKTAGEAQRVKLLARDPTVRKLG